MALPSLGTPKFITSIPSTGQEIQYRPFLVKEEKILLMALEGGDEKEIQRAISDILSSCILTEIDVGKLAVFDVEFLFMNLRGKSVGENIELRVGHQDSECTHKTEISINIDDIKVSGNISDGKIEVTDQIGVKLKYPSITDVTRFSSETSEGMFKMIASCIEYVYDQNEVYNEFTIEEMVEWLEGLNQGSFQKITTFFETLPKLSHTIEWKCSKCGETEKVVLEGLNSFFM
jgi:hypothetical protein